MNTINGFAIYFIHFTYCIKFILDGLFLSLDIRLYHKRGNSMQSLSFGTDFQLSQHQHQPQLPFRWENLGGKDKFLSCQVPSRRDLSSVNISLILNSGHLERVIPPRSSLCELEALLAKNNPSGEVARHLSPMGRCGRQFEGLIGCGCPELDPINNPRLWKKYQRRALKAIPSAPKTNEFTVTFFASGLLLYELVTLDKIVCKLNKKGWRGQINAQFIDFKYARDERESEAIAGQIENLECQQTDWSNYTIASAVVGWIAAGFFGYFEKKRTIKPNYFLEQWE